MGGRRRKIPARLSPLQSDLMKASRDNDILAVAHIIQDLLKNNGLDRSITPAAAPAAEIESSGSSSSTSTFPSAGISETRCFSTELFSAPVDRAAGAEEEEEIDCAGTSSNPNSCTSRHCGEQAAATVKSTGDQASEMEQQLGRGCTTAPRSATHPEASSSIGDGAAAAVERALKEIFPSGGPDEASPSTHDSTSSPRVEAAQVVEHQRRVPQEGAIGNADPSQTSPTVGTAQTRPTTCEDSDHRGPPGRSVALNPRVVHARTAAILSAKQEIQNVDQLGSHFTALHIAAMKGHLEIVRLLVTAGCEVNGVTSRGLSPTHIASKKGHLEVVRFLSRKRATPERMPDLLLERDMVRDAQIACVDNQNKRVKLEKALRA
ncbi:unnamed protein product [Amoebophrya sp. A120]|nr:unnamed protein product [Amoebophrya sp. A120]|eukprot:GSA120T00011729001.1